MTGLYITLAVIFIPIIVLRLYYWFLAYAFRKGMIEKQYRWAKAEEELPPHLSAIYYFILFIVYLVSVLTYVSCSNSWRISSAKLAAGKVVTMTSGLIVFEFNTLENPKKTIKASENFVMYRVFNGYPSIKEGDKVLVLYYPSECEKCDLDCKVDFNYVLDKKTPMGGDLEKIVKREDISLALSQW